MLKLRVPGKKLPEFRIMKSSNRSTRASRSGVIKLIVIAALLLCVTAAVTSLLYQRVKKEQVVGKDALTAKVFRSEFVATVNESGDIESSSNVEIRCEVKSQGKAGTAILELVNEGAIVEKGQFLCQLDDSVLKNDLTEQKIKVAEDRAAMIQAENDLIAAQGILTEFQQGTYAQELAKLNAAVRLAEEAQKRADEYYAYSEVLASKGYITRTQLQADQFAAEKAELDVQLARKESSVFSEFTKDRLIAEYKAEIKKQQAQLEAKKFTLELSEARQKDLENQIKACRIVAPSAGMVVYANETDRRGDSTFVIEEGALIRDGQPIFRLPDPNRMQVRATVNDSKINSVKEKQPVLVRIDTAPENPVRGIVRKVSAFPQPRRWYQAPIEYEVFIDIVEKSPLVRPGLRGKVEIFTERIPDVIQSPVSSLVRHEDHFYIIERVDGGRLIPHEVEIGSNNEQNIVLVKGVEPGMEVLVDPDQYLDSISFPQQDTSSPSSTAGADGSGTLVTP